MSLDPLAVHLDADTSTGYRWELVRLAGAAWAVAALLLALQAGQLSQPCESRFLAG